MKTRLCFAVIVFATVSLFSRPALAQFSQQGPKLAASGGSQQGSSVGLSADGNTAIVGDFSDGGYDNEHGAARVWIRSGGVWTQQGNKLVGSGAVGNAFQGNAVALSADGNTAIVGGYNDRNLFDNSTSGAAWVWTRSGGVWTQQGTKLVATGTPTPELQGLSVSLSADGNTALIGALEGAFVWIRSGGVWSEQGAPLIGSGAFGGGALQGRSVSLSADGNTAVIGGPADNNYLGAAWVWTRSAGVWTQQGTKLAGTGAVGQPNQGNAVALSPDGNTAVVGGPRDNADFGAVWVWTRSNGAWTQQGSKLVGSGGVGAPLQGLSVATDGNRAIVGGPHDNGRGAAWIWTRSGGIWTQQGNKLIGSGAVGNAHQGWSVSLSADGNSAIVGGPEDAVNGAAWVFVAAPADLIAKLVWGAAPFPAGGFLNYTITVTNNGPGSASNVIVTDVLPTGTTLVSATPSQACNGTTTVTCGLGSLANGGTATINLIVKTSSTPGVVSNPATVTAAEVDPNPANNSSTSTITTIDPLLIPVASAWTFITLIGMLAMVGAMKIRC